MLLYKFAGNNYDYKSYNGNAALLWHVAKIYREKGYRKIILGGSKIKPIEDFKRRISTSSYVMKEKNFFYVLYKKALYHFKKIVRKNR